MHQPDSFRAERRGFLTQLQIFALRVLEFLMLMTLICPHFWHLDGLTPLFGIHHGILYLRMTSRHVWGSQDLDGSPFYETDQLAQPYPLREDDPSILDNISFHCPT